MARSASANDAAERGRRPGSLANDASRRSAKAIGMEPERRAGGGVAQETEDHGRRRLAREGDEGAPAKEQLVHR